MRRSFNRTEGLLFYIITPLVFALIICFAVVKISAPVLNPIMGALNLLSRSEVASDGDHDVVISDIFNNSGDNNTTVDNRDHIQLGTFQYPTSGVKFGQIKVENTKVDCGLYMNDDEKELKKGAGVSLKSNIPGDNGTTLIAGHCASFFSTLGGAKVGDKIYISTNYGNYVYEIFDIQIKNKNELTDSKVNEELSYTDNRLILYTCYPFNTLYSVSQRYFVYAKYVSGPVITR